MNHRLQEISEFLFEKPKLYGLHIIFTSAVTFHTHTCACRCVLCVADSARDVVLLQVSASSEGQEWGDEIWLIKKRTKRQILK